MRCFQAAGTWKESASSQTGRWCRSCDLPLLGDDQPVPEEEEVPLLGLGALNQHHGALEDRLSLLGGQVQLLEGYGGCQAFPEWERVGMSLLGTVVGRQIGCEESQLRTASHQESGLTGVEIRRENSEEANCKLLFVFSFKTGFIIKHHQSRNVGPASVNSEYMLIM